MENSYILSNELVVSIYTIGFDPKGESILITISDGSIILFSGLIDCFITENDYVLKLLNSLEIRYLNYLCITHPDNDHCVGIPSIIDKINSKTKIALPNRIFDFMDQYDAKVKESLESLRELLNLRRGNEKKPRFNTVSDNQTIIDNWQFIDYIGKQNKLKIVTVSPSSNVIEKYALKQSIGDVIVEHNAFSIINLIQIDDIKILLTSDVENDNIGDVFDNLTEFSYLFFNSKIDFVKIPHHTSKGSNLLLDKIKAKGEGIGCSATTIFRSCSLPDYSLLSDYNSCSDMSFCTGKSKTEEKKSGIILYQVDVTNHQRKITLMDNAVKFENYIQQI